MAYTTRSLNWAQTLSVSFDDCNECAKKGHDAFGLIILAFAVVCLSGFGSVSPSARLTYANLACSFISGLTVLLGFGFFMHFC